MIYFIFHVVMTAFIVLSIFLLAYIVNFSQNSNNYSKHSPYECGFEPFGSARMPFDLQFFTVGLLFIIFDVEVAFLVPFVIDISNLSAGGYCIFALFLLIVVLGFFFEWIVYLID